MGECNPQCLIGWGPFSSGSNRKTSIGDLTGWFQVPNLFSQLPMPSNFLSSCCQECTWFVCVVGLLWGWALLHTSDTRFEQLAPHITRLKLVIQCPVIFVCLFVYLLFKLCQQKWYPTDCVIRCRYPALLDTCQGCRSRSQRGYGSLCCCLFHSPEIPQLIIKGYQNLFFWHLTKPRSFSCTRQRDALDVWVTA